ncbi:hypothetical protein [Hyalangium gracile]|uniref:hypothetical protein n=1 Tax=Hyalangium gracile TaxID=394092 RepID=UPI001CCCCE17|nr:hypothetical protein [Hyalangium gracile]
MLRTLLVTLVACEGAPLNNHPSPVTVVSIEPSEMTTDAPTALILQLSGLPAHLDYGRGHATLPPITVTFGAVLSVPGEPLPHDRVRAQVPQGLPPGSYDVGIQLADGHTASLPMALIVREAPDGGTPDGGTPDGGGPPPGITGFSFQTLSEQVQGVPFVIAIRAMGPDAVRFQGTVELSSAWQVTPSVTEPFHDGVLVMDVSIQTPGDTVTLTARDSEGRTGTSNPFRVRPAP